MPLAVLPLLAARAEGMFDLFGALQDTLQDNGARLQEGDVLAISTKYVSNAQGRILDLRAVRASRGGQEISKRFRMGQDMAEAILRESETVFGGIGGFVITSSLLPSPHASSHLPHGSIMAPNAGIDRSNARGMAILYPANPFLVAEQIRRKAFLRWAIHIGVILVDSRLMPARVGTSGIAVACAGVEPVRDMRSSMDLDGNPLRVTFQATADNLATIANQTMGEASESRPFAIIRDSGAALTDRGIGPAEMAVSPAQCVYVRGLSGPCQAGRR